MTEHPIRSKSAAPGRSITGLALGFALALAMLALARTAFAATFTASLDRDTVTQGESLTLSLTFSGANPQEPPNLPPIPNLPITYVGPSSQVSFANGQVSSTMTFNFTVTPRQPGEYIIPTMTAEVGGEKLTTQPIKLKVVPPSAPSAEAIKSGSELAFLKVIVPKNQIYVGETITAEVQLFLRQGVQRLDDFQINGGDGLNLGKMVSAQNRRAQVGNTMYTVVPVNIALKAVKNGVLSGRVTASIVIEVPSGNSPRGFFGFEMNERKQLSVAGDPVSLEALSLPSENAPTNFNGAIGSYSMNVSAGPTNVAVGDPITVRVQLSGHGALDALALSDQPAWQDFKTYPPTSKTETSDALGLQGNKTFEQVVVPQNPEIKALPPFSFSFFDPELKQYKTLTQPAIPLLVRASVSPAATTVAATARQEPAPPAQDIVDIKQRFGAMAQIGPPLLQQPWFVALQMTPLLAFVSALVWRRRVDTLANNPRLRRQRQVEQIVLEGIEELRVLAAQNKSEEFFATLFRLLQEQLGERLDLPATAITEAVVDERLRPARVPESTLAPLQELFHTCNVARYAPIKSSQELAAVIPKLETTLRQIQEVKV